MPSNPAIERLPPQLRACKQAPFRKQRLDAGLLTQVLLLDFCRLLHSENGKLSE